MSKCGADRIMSKQCTFQRDKVKVCSRRSLTFSPYSLVDHLFSRSLFLPLLYILHQPFLHCEHIVLRRKGPNVHVTEHMVLEGALRKPTVWVHLNARAELQVSTLHACFTVGPCMYRVSIARWSKAKKIIQFCEVRKCIWQFLQLGLSQVSLQICNGSKNKVCQSHGLRCTLGTGRMPLSRP